MGPLPWHEVYTLVHTFFSNVVILHSIVLWINQILGVGQFIGKNGDTLTTLTVCI